MVLKKKIMSPEEIIFYENLMITHYSTLPQCKSNEDGPSGQPLDDGPSGPKGQPLDDGPSGHHLDGLSGQPLDDQNCAHNLLEEQNKLICSLCGLVFENQVLDCKNLISNIGINRKETSNITYDLPNFIEQNIKNVAIDIFNQVTKNNNFVVRNKLKKALLLASLHRASAYLGKHISYNDLLEMFNLKPYQANKGFMLLLTFMNKNSKFNFLTDKNYENILNLLSKIKKLNIPNDPELVNLAANLYKFITTTEVSNFSQPNSIICGCIYFFLKMKYNISIEDFISQIQISKLTLMKVLLLIWKKILNKEIKNFFVLFFLNCENYNIQDKNLKFILNSVKNIYITQPFEKDKITFYHNDEMIDICLLENIDELNILLGKYTSEKGKQYVLDIQFNKDKSFNFCHYDLKNKINGKKILDQYLINVFGQPFVETITNLKK